MPPEDGRVGAVACPCRCWRRGVSEWVSGAGAAVPGAARVPGKAGRMQWNRVCAVSWLVLQTTEYIFLVTLCRSLLIAMIIVMHFPAFLGLNSRSGLFRKCSAPLQRLENAQACYMRERVSSVCPLLWLHTHKNRIYWLVLRITRTRDHRDPKPKFRIINAALVVLVLQEIEMGDDTLQLKNVSDNWFYFFIYLKRMKKYHKYEDSWDAVIYCSVLPFFGAKRKPRVFV